MKNKSVHVMTCLEDPVTLDRTLQRSERFPSRNSAYVVDNKKKACSVLDCYIFVFIVQS
jgi:hypothetical protein